MNKRNLWFHTMHEDKKDLSGLEIFKKVKYTGKYSNRIQKERAVQVATEKYWEQIISLRFIENLTLKKIEEKALGGNYGNGNLAQSTLQFLGFETSKSAGKYKLNAEDIKKFIEQIKDFDIF